MITRGPIGVVEADALTEFWIRRWADRWCSMDRAAIRSRMMVVQTHNGLYRNSCGRLSAHLAQRSAEIAEARLEAHQAIARLVFIGYAVMLGLVLKKLQKATDAITTPYWHPPDEHPIGDMIWSDPDPFCDWTFEGLFDGCGLRPPF